MGLFALVLHSHLPYVRRNGTWPSGEDFFHQAAFESYLPLARALVRLIERGIQPNLTIGFSPPLAHQMQDQHMHRELTLWLGRVELRAWRAAADGRGEHASAFLEIAAREARRARTALQQLETTRAGITGAFRDLAQPGGIQIIGGPASHPYLPLVRQPSLLRAHVMAGASEHERIFGRRPSAMWLPECAFRPQHGIEQALESEGISAFLVDPSVLPEQRPTLVGDSSVIAVPFDRSVSDRVWSAKGGYPTAALYRDFHSSDLDTGFKNWRVTDVDTRIAKEPYEAGAGSGQAHTDAENFVHVLEHRFEELGDDALVIAAWDTELFGHWWYEGIDWLERLLEILAGHRRIRMVTLEEAVSAAGTPSRVQPAAGSWGDGRDDRSWVGAETSEMWTALAAAEEETVRLCARFGRQNPAGVDQLIREYFLLAASDWPFLVLRGNNAGYARERFAAHSKRHRRLAQKIREGSPDLAAIAAGIFEIDNIFPDLSRVREHIQAHLLPTFGGP